MFIARERAGGSRAIRDGIRREVGHFTAEMATDFGLLGVPPNLTPAAQLMIAEIVVLMMLDSAVDIIDLPPGKPGREAELVSRLVGYLVVVFLGAQAWREKP